ncbi:MAG: tRNA (adenosine(37)-N6)-threonylcarbamoyltransferase complex dimerization subunit type 1 TsaB [Lachnospiraceae bacterium]|jgi:tRNA threonylcarbamoyladenosine biosynthesis protein TsaB|nr:tRNA (adenosine(37)-N6)-threonylcarbamoyltransferase complex dimerization subunit type 1 TsaB [Lachnospiraceae bacterium]
MRILALDSSGLVAGVALMEDDTLIAEYTLNHKKTHSQTLLPMIDELFQMTGMDKKSIDAVAIAGGPGSFTGLRIGAATAKGLAQALEIPVIKVPTVDALAYNLYGTGGIIAPLMDARRNQVYTGLFTFEGFDFKVVRPQCAVGIEEIVSEINAMGKPVIFLGDGVPVNKEYIEANVTAAFDFAPAHLSRQRAGAVGALAIRYADDKDYPSVCSFAAADFVPDYLRLSQAEREMLEKEREKKSV